MLCFGRRSSLRLWRSSSSRWVTWRAPAKTPRYSMRREEEEKVSWLKSLAPSQLFVIRVSRRSSAGRAKRQLLRCFHGRTCRQASAGRILSHVGELRLPCARRRGRGLTMANYLFGNYVLDVDERRLLRDNE